MPPERMHTGQHLPGQQVPPRSVLLETILCRVSYGETIRHIQGGRYAWKSEHEADQPLGSYPITNHTVG
ncbi:MAG: hypothetical protein MK110_12370 [Fuerstiella sp.]|nr:hypothetical protein [Fuerstiella sp.]